MLVRSDLVRVRIMVGVRVRVRVRLGVRVRARVRVRHHILEELPDRVQAGEVRPG